MAKTSEKTVDQKIDCFLSNIETKIVQMFHDDWKNNDDMTTAEVDELVKNGNLDEQMIVEHFVGALRMTLYKNFKPNGVTKFK